jgi:Spy/CpxP family protein refolding chaperone
MKRLVAIVALAVMALSTTAEARYGRRPHHGFATGHCKRASCYAKHPGGTYRYPYHYGHRRH